MGKKSAGLLVLTLVVVTAVVGLKYTRNSSTPEVTQPLAKMAEAKAVPAEAPKVPPTLPPEIVKLNAIQAEIGKLSDEDIESQLDSLKTKLKAENLIEKMNKGMAEGEEKERAKDMLIRVSLLTVEKTKRGKKANS